MLFKQKQKVLCVGSAGKDIFFPMDSSDFLKKVENNKNISQLCFPLGSKIHIKDRFVALGGCACNVSVGLSRLNISTSIFGITGKDSDGDYIKKNLTNENVDVKYLQTDEKNNTDISVIIVDFESGDRTIFVNRDVGEKLKVDSAVFKNYEWCYVGSLYGDNSVENVKIIHNNVKNSNLKLAYNPGGSNIKNNPKEVQSLLFHSSLIFVNKSEASRIAKILKSNVADDVLNSEEELMKILYKYSENATIVLTNGSEGAWGYAGDKIYYEKVSGKKALDTTGAGDAFSSGFFAAIVHRYDVDVAMKWGMMNSHNVIKFYGAHEGLLNYDDLGGVC
ncbi:MAG: carbohydrate kinase family protein [Candidatus Moranbacteria bacterium]|nr:carbohydrate kinase family protein [Candidatus Moranbacteria bacterium]